MLAGGHTTNEEFIELNAAVTDLVLYDDRWFYNVPPEETLTEEEIICLDPQVVESNFVYSLRNIYELWYIYFTAVGIALLNFLLNLFSNHYKKNIGKFLFNGIRGERDQ